jgi:hypothetical protein
MRELKTFHTAAGWVPYDDERDLDADDEAAALLIDALLDQCQGHEPPVLVATTLGGDGHGVVSDFARRYGVTSYRDRQGYGRGPALVYMPDGPALEYATRMAHSRPIAVIEGLWLSMRGWAVATRARNILAPDEPAEEFPEPVAKELARLEFYKNNAWGDTLGKRVARQSLDSIRRSGFTDRGAIKSWLIAHGASGRRMQRLDKAMDELGYPAEVV